MRRAGWLGIGIIVTFVVAGTVSVIPATATTIQSLLGTSGLTASSTSGEPAWNTGNLCTSIFYSGPGDVSCVSKISNSQSPLWYNFSAGTVERGTVTVSIYGSNDCIYMNFHSFYTTVNIYLLGNDYFCGTGHGKGGAWLAPLWGSGGGGGTGQSRCSAGFGGGGGWLLPVEWAQKPKCTPGVNIVVNSEGDTINLFQSPPRQHSCDGSSGRYSTNVTLYGTTTVFNLVQSRSADDLNTTVTYIGIKPGFAACPWGITDGLVPWWTDVSYGSHNTFNTIFVDGTNVAHPPPNYQYSTEPLLPPDGTSYGKGNLYGNETTQTAPAGTCHYLGV